MPRPKTGHTPIRHVRVSDALWDQVDELARDTGRTRTQVVVEAIERYLKAAKRQR